MSSNKEDWIKWVAGIIKLRFVAVCNAMAVGHRMICSIKHQKKICDPWEKKVKSWIICIRLRELTPKKLPTKKKKRNPSNWKKCVSDMWFHARAVYKYRLDLPWRKWSTTVARNQNRRIEGKMELCKKKNMV